MASIYGQIGGLEAVSSVVDNFYERVLGDPSLAPLFGDTDISRLKSHQRMFIAAALGGPENYLGRGMGEAHRPLGIDDAAFDSVVGHLVASLEAHDVDERTIGQIGERLAPLRGEIVST